MPIIFKGNRVCEKCGESFEWNYFELRRQRFNCHQEVETIPSQLKVHKCLQESNDTFYIEVNCPKCGYDNHFTYKLLPKEGDC